jgi:hypothetical protein
LSKDKLFFLKLRQGDKIPSEAKIIQTDGIDSDEQGRFIFVTLLLPQKETEETMLSKARSCYIGLINQDGVLHFLLLERAVQDGQYLYELSNAGKVLSSYNTRSANFVSFCWVHEKGMGLEAFALDLLKSNEQGVKQ